MNLSGNVPKYILSKKQTSFNVVFTALFSLMAALLLAPLSANGWFRLDPGRAMVLTISFWAFCFLLLGFSRAGLYSLREKNITTLMYILWCTAEAVVVSLLYTAVSYLGIKYGWIISPESHGAGMHFLNCMIFCVFGLGVPNVISIQYFAISERDQTIRLMNFSTVVSDTVSTPQTDKRIMLYDSSGVLKLVINQDNLYYIESDDNYIKVWYQDSNDELKQYMLRCRLKTIEESFADSDLVRCHRKYIVNINKIEQMTRQKDGTFSIDLGLQRIMEPISVSKTYEESFFARFNSR